MEDADAPEGVRCFVMMGEEVEVGLVVARNASPPVFAGALPEIGLPSDEECVEGLESLVRRCGVPEVDVEKGYESYRRQVMETMPLTLPMPEWGELVPAVREAFAAGIWDAVKGGAA